MAKKLHFLLTLIAISLSFFFHVISSDSSVDSFVYGGCSQIKYTPNSPYESNLNSLLTSFINSATYSSYNKFSIMGSTKQDILYGVYQCRGDLSMPDCATCVAKAVSQVDKLCSQNCGGALQLQGCFVKYDNTSFLGVEDKTCLLNKCGPSNNGLNEDSMGRVLTSLNGADGLYRVGGSLDVHGVAQCVGDLSNGQCQDCLSEAIGRLKSECGGAAYGDMFLGKCYARFITSGAHFDAKSNHGSHFENEKTFALIIGLLAGVALLIIFLTFIRRIFGRNGK
ncbi:plasmodesmata-located protein 7-like [Nicotiana tomentosiformis]|uniref:plasmodesmata-located protein 7-like n=1 Tax=Nicotiana tomentosiformis TaxID=4098 RepID=UPI00051C2CC6|nr:plasmodesmata-located protein 7-like [Nicotiana tomentosiformis]